MNVSKLSSKGQITVPKPVRDALQLEPGDRVLFRVEGNRAVLARAPDFLELAGTVAIPPEKRGLSWREVRRRAHASLTKSRS
jgi:antitoxin PrlF